MPALHSRIGPPISYHDRFEVNGGPSFLLGHLVAIPDMTGKDRNVSTTVWLASKVEWSPLEIFEAFKPYGEECMNISSCFGTCGWKRNMISVGKSNINSIRPLVRRSWGLVFSYGWSRNKRFAARFHPHWFHAVPLGWEGSTIHGPACGSVTIDGL